MNDIEAAIKYEVIVSDLTIRVDKQANLIIAQMGQLAVKDAKIQDLKTQLGEATKKLEKATNELKYLGQTNKIERNHNQSTTRAHKRAFQSWYPEQYPNP